MLGVVREHSRGHCPDIISVKNVQINSCKLGTAAFWWFPKRMNFLFSSLLTPGVVRDHVGLSFTPSSVRIILLHNSWKTSTIHGVKYQDDWLWKSLKPTQEKLSPKKSANPIQPSDYLLRILGLISISNKADYSLTFIFGVKDARLMWWLKGWALYNFQIQIWKCMFHSEAILSYLNTIWGQVADKSADHCEICQ